MLQKEESKLFYFILAILLLLYYVFAATPAIKGTLNLVLLVFGVVLFLTLLILVAMQITQSPIEIWVGVIMVLLGLWSLWDISQMEKKGDPPRDKRTRETFLSKFF